MTVTTDVPVKPSNDINIVTLNGKRST